MAYLCNLTPEAYNVLENYVFTLKKVVLHWGRWVLATRAHHSAVCANHHPSLHSLPQFIPLLNCH